MSARRAYVDASCLVALVLNEPNAAQVRDRLAAFETLLAHPLVEAEVRSAAAREKLALDLEELDNLTWMPVARVGTELARVLAAGYLRGADAFHLACALYASPVPSDLTFLTLDTKQRAVAKSLGFRT
jgi:predicted nucleic acid-binding protein